MSARVAVLPLLALRCGLAALWLAACASPALTASAPGPGVPRIISLEVTPARVDSGCPVTLRIDFEDAGGDVVRAVTRWRARTGNQRYHVRTDVLPIAVTALGARTTGHADVVVIPPHAGAYVYRVQLEDTQGRTSNVAEADVSVVIRPIWRAARCDTPGPAPSERPAGLEPVTGGDNRKEG